MIACFASDQVLKSLHHQVQTSPSKNKAYIDGLNLALRNLVRQVPCTDLILRYTLILELLGPNIDLFHPCHLQFRKAVRGSDIVVEKLLIEVGRRFAEAPSRELEIFADACLAQVVVYTRISKVDEILETYVNFAGDATMQSLLDTPVMITWLVPVMERLYKPLLRRYALANLADFTFRIITGFIGTVPFQNLISLLELEVPEISITPNRLILGSSTYIRPNRQVAEQVLWQEIPRLQPTCSTCSESLTSIYIRPNDSHGVFYCKTCAGPTGSRAACTICFTDDTEGLQLKIASCNHVFCSECCEKIFRCPMCRADIPVIQVDVSEAVEIFVARGKT